MGQEIIWEHFQNEGVDVFDTSAGRCSMLVRRLQPGQAVLNIGVGNAGLERRAKAKGVDIHSLDPSPTAIDRARTSLELGDKAKVGFSQAIPFPDNHFDVVIMSEVLEHLTDDILETTLLEVDRVLKPNGLFLGTVPARERLIDNAALCPSCGHHFHRWGHVQQFDVDRLSGILRSRFSSVAARETFILDREATGPVGKVGGWVKKFLSWRGIGPYGANRSIYFEARH